jgi:hypothetical protein
MRRNLILGIMTITGNHLCMRLSQGTEQINFQVATGEAKVLIAEDPSLPILEITGSKRMTITTAITPHIPFIEKIKFRFASDVLKLSQIINQIARANTKSLGDTQKGMQANPLLSPFDFTDVNGMQTGLFGQLFLAHFGLLALFPNGIAQDFELTRTRHSQPAKQVYRKTRTPNMGLFLSCNFLERA